MDGEKGAVIPETLSGFPARWVLAGGALVLACAIIGWQRVQLSDCRASLAEHKAAYLMLAKQVQIQNAAVQDLERKAAGEHVTAG